MKRVFDLALALAALPFALPVMALAMAAIRIETAGSPLIAQPRIGRDGRVFTCYKLRTMRAGTASVPTHLAPVAAVTRTGAILRATKIDELPQLFNVIGGSMSLVGPRPGLASDTALADARRRAGVLALRPGITGISQVDGIDMRDPERLAQSDARYLEAAWFPTDIILIARTVTGIFRPGN